MSGERYETEVEVNGWIWRPGEEGGERMSGWEGETWPEWSIATDEEWEEGRKAALAELGLTYEQLEAHAAAGTLPSERARLTWMMLMPDDGPSWCGP